MLVRSTKRIAGFPPPGEVGEVDDERAVAAIERGDAEDMTSLSARLRRTPEIVTGGGSVPPTATPSGDVPDVEYAKGGFIAKGDAPRLDDA